MIIRGIAIDAGVRAGSLSSLYVDETLVSGGSFGLDPHGRFFLASEGLIPVPYADDPVKRPE